MNKILGKTFKQIKPYIVKSRAQSIDKNFWRAVAIAHPITVIGHGDKYYIIVNADTGSLQLACRVNYYRLRRYFKEV